MECIRKFFRAKMSCPLWPRLHQTRTQNNAVVIHVRCSCLNNAFLPDATKLSSRSTVWGGSNESNRRKPVNAQYTPLPGTKHRWINRPCFRFNKLNNIFLSTCCCYFSIVFCWEMGIGSFFGRLIHCLHSPHTHSPRSRSRTRILPFICAENIIIMLFWTARNGERPMSANWICWFCWLS